MVPRVCPVQVESRESRVSVTLESEKVERYQKRCGVCVSIPKSGQPAHDPEYRTVFNLAQYSALVF